VTLPLIAPYLIAAFGLSFALSMGELGATVMVYPPGWITLPVANLASPIEATFSREQR
jgi:2-aminoethylphosphonate transport system permease protein